MLQLFDVLVQYHKLILFLFLLYHDNEISSQFHKLMFFFLSNHVSEILIQFHKVMFLIKS